MRYACLTCEPPPGYLRLQMGNLLAARAHKKIYAAHFIIAEADLDDAPEDIETMMGVEMGSMNDANPE